MSSEQKGAAKLTDTMIIRLLRRAAKPELVENNTVLIDFVKIAVLPALMDKFLKKFVVFVRHAKRKTIVKRDIELLMEVEGIAYESLVTRTLIPKTSFRALMRECYFFVGADPLKISGTALALLGRVFETQFSMHLEKSKSYIDDGRKTLRYDHVVKQFEQLRKCAALNALI